MRFTKLAISFTLSTFCGVVAGMGITVPLLAFYNVLATDGPYFPPVLVAPLLVLPIAFGLAPVQFLVLLARSRSGTWRWQTYLLVGGIGGSLVGLILNVAVSSPFQSFNAIRALQWTAVGMIQGSVTLGSLPAIQRLGVWR